ncbi:hypothetical protein N9937_00060 [bacterium]|nr:hypothetical protein [bacterium]
MMPNKDCPYCGGHGYVGHGKDIIGCQPCGFCNATGEAPTFDWSKVECGIKKGELKYITSGVGVGRSTVSFDDFVKMSEELEKEQQRQAQELLRVLGIDCDDFDVYRDKIFVPLEYAALKIYPFVNTNGFLKDTQCILHKAQKPLELFDRAKGYVYSSSPFTD